LIGIVVIGKKKRKGDLEGEDFEERRRSFKELQRKLGVGILLYLSFNF